jgi:hypothetical protein
MTLTSGPNAVRVTQVDRGAKPLPEPERRARILRGLQRLTDEAQQLGREKAASEAQTLIDQAVVIVGQLTDIEAAIAAPRKNHVAAAAADAAKTLLKSLPGCFANAGEAAAWACSHLPLTEARRQAGRDELERTRLSQRRHVLRQSFWRATEAAALLVAARVSGMCDGGKCLDEAERVGRFI